MQYFALNGTLIGFITSNMKENPMNKIMHITKSDFKKGKLIYQGIALVECYDSSIAPLHIMKPILSKLRMRYYKAIVHLQVNVSKNQFIINDFLVRSIPTYLLFKNGELVDKVEGILPYEEFSNMLTKHLTRKQLYACGTDRSCSPVFSQEILIQ